MDVLTQCCWYNRLLSTWFQRMIELAVRAFKGVRRSRDVDMVDKGGSQNKIIPTRSTCINCISNLRKRIDIGWFRRIPHINICCRSLRSSLMNQIVIMLYSLPPNPRRKEITGLGF